MYGDAAYEMAARKEYNHPEILDACPLHGWVVHSPDRICWLCVPDQPESYRRAKLMGHSGYWTSCSIHGSTPHMMRGLKCAKCFTVVGKPRIQNEARAAARRKGQAVYPDNCSVHGYQVPFSTGPGKCLTCYNATGYPRPAFRCTP